MAEEEFIDAESEPWKHEKIDYEKIILKQINLCADNLSKERIGGFTNEKGKYIGDVCSEIINSVAVLEDLMTPVLGKGDETNIKDIKNKLKEEIEKLGEEEVTVGSFRGKVKDIKAPIPPTHPLMKWRMDFEADKYKEIFGALLIAFYKNKMKIRELSRE